MCFKKLKNTALALLFLLKKATFFTDFIFIDTQLYFSKRFLSCIKKVQDYWLKGFVNILSKKIIAFKSVYNTFKMTLNQELVNLFLVPLALKSYLY